MVRLKVALAQWWYAPARVDTGGTAADKDHQRLRDGEADSVEFVAQGREKLSEQGSKTS